MQHELRIYQIKPGTMDDFIAGWREYIVPLRLKHEFTVEHAWTNVDSDKSEFVWLVGYAGADGYAAADARYYASPDRASLAWNPMQYIDQVELRILDPVPITQGAQAG